MASCETKTGSQQLNILWTLMATGNSIRDVMFVAGSKTFRREALVTKGTFLIHLNTSFTVLNGTGFSENLSGSILREATLLVVVLIVSVKFVVRDGLTFLLILGYVEIRRNLQ